MAWPFRHRPPTPAGAPPPRRDGEQGWRALPAVRTTILPPRPVAPAIGFIRGLSSRTRTSVTHGTLGHGVATEAPIGIAALAASWPVSGPELGARRPSDRSRARRGEVPIARPPTEGAPRQTAPGDRPLPSQTSTDLTGARRAEAPEPWTTDEPAPREATIADGGSDVGSDRRRDTEPPMRAATKEQPVIDPGRASPASVPGGEPRGTDPRTPPRELPIVGAVVRPLIGRRPPPTSFGGPRAGSPAAAPGDVRSMVERRLGVDLGHAPIVRDRRSTQQARQLKARGFTGDGVMHIPREAGSLQEPRTKALVAHELVHVAQQRRGNVPPHPETHGAGRVLEAEAVGIEREWLRVPSPSGRMDTAGGRAPAVDLPGTGTTEGAGPVPPTPPTATGARPVGIQAAAQTGAETPAAGASERDAVTKLYEQVVARLRADLLVDRERAGTLADRR